MSAPRQGYILTCKPKKTVSDHMSYRSDKDVTVTRNFSRSSGCSFLCIKFSNSGGMGQQWTGPISFTSEEQKDAFETALRNNDARTALKVIEALHPNRDNEDGMLSMDPVKKFLRDYIASETKQETPKTSCCGLFSKKRQPLATYQAVAIDDPSLKTPSLVSDAILQAMGVNPDDLKPKSDAASSDASKPAIEPVITPPAANSSLPGTVDNPSNPVTDSLPVTVVNPAAPVTEEKDAPGTSLKM